MKIVIVSIGLVSASCAGKGGGCWVCKLGGIVRQNRLKKTKRLSRCQRIQAGGRISALKSCAKGDLRGMRRMHWRMVLSSKRIVMLELCTKSSREKTHKQSR